MPDRFKGYSPETLQFLLDLAMRNEREWFAENKAVYEKTILEPSLAFIGEFAPRLEKISGHFQAVPKKVGGSLMRIYRDTRFGKDKRPYKTNIGIQFRHALGKDVHAPGFYVHIALEECFIGVGMWRPDRDALAAVRKAIDRDPEGWIAARDDKKFRKNFSLGGDSLQRPPKGYDKDHPLLEDIRRKDHIAFMQLDMESIMNAKMLDKVQRAFANASPYMAFLCKAVGAKF